MANRSDLYPAHSPCAAERDGGGCMAAEGNALERYRARLMLAVTDDGPLETEVPELTRMFLEEIVVHTPTEMTVGFLDGSRVSVCL